MLFFSNTYMGHGVKMREKKLLDEGLSMLRHTQMFGRNLGFACYKWLEKITKIFPKWWDALMMIYRGRNLKKNTLQQTQGTCSLHDDPLAVVIVKCPMWVVVHVAASYIILFLDHRVYPSLKTNINP